MQTCGVAGPGCSCRRSHLSSCSCLCLAVSMHSSGVPEIGRPGRSSQPTLPARTTAAAHFLASRYPMDMAAADSATTPGRLADSLQLSRLMSPMATVAPGPAFTSGGPGHFVQLHISRTLGPNSSHSRAAIPGCGAGPSCRLLPQRTDPNQSGITCWRQ